MALSHGSYHTPRCLGRAMVNQMATGTTLDSKQSTTPHACKGALGWDFRLVSGVMRIVAGLGPLAMVHIIPWDVGERFWSAVQAPMADSLENDTRKTSAQLLYFVDSNLLLRFSGSFEFLVCF